MSVNKVILVGNVGRDPEIRQLQDGSKVATFSVATSESWKKDPEWHKVVVMNDILATSIEKYVKKGSKVYVEGTIQYKKWNDAKGIERNTTEIFVGKFKGEFKTLERAPESVSVEEESGTKYTYDSDSKAFNKAVLPKSVAAKLDNMVEEAPDLDDEIPF
jgi:single-strand DNA-binding protein